MTIEYDELARWYEFTVPRSLLTPEGSFAAFAASVEGLPRGARVFDCACGVGYLAVGLAAAGFMTTATDASPMMVDRTAALAAEHAVELETEVRRWDQLAQAGWGERFDAVFCVGNSLTHAGDRAARRDALRQMTGTLRPGGRLVLTSRNWELVRQHGSRLVVGDEILERNGRRGILMHAWLLAEDWDSRHDLFIAVALLLDAGRVRSHTEHLTFWPFRHADLLDDLAHAGLDVLQTTFARDVERYLVIAQKHQAVDV